MEKFCERLNQVVDYYANGRNTFFANLIGMRESNVRSWLSGTLPKVDVIEKIANNCEKLNLEWLLTGEGSMLKSEEPTPTVQTPQETPSNDLIMPLLDRIDTLTRENERLRIENARLEMDLERMRLCATDADTDTAVRAV